MQIEIKKIIGIRENRFEFEIKKKLIGNQKKKQKKKQNKKKTKQKKKQKKNSCRRSRFQVDKTTVKIDR